MKRPEFLGLVDCLYVPFPKSSASSQNVLDSRVRGNDGILLFLEAIKISWPRRAHAVCLSRQRKDQRTRSLLTNIVAAQSLLADQRVRPYSPSDTSPASSPA